MISTNGFSKSIITFTPNAKNIRCFALIWITCKEAAEPEFYLGSEHNRYYDQGVAFAILFLFIQVC